MADQKNQNPQQTQTGKTTQGTSSADLNKKREEERKMGGTGRSGSLENQEDQEERKNNPTGKTTSTPTNEEEDETSDQNKRRDRDNESRS